MEMRQTVEKRLEELRCERARLDAVIAELSALLGGSESPPPGKERVPVPPAAKPKPRGRKSAGAEARRLSVAKLLADGPLRLADIGKRLNIPEGSRAGVISHPWFEKDAAEPFSPYRLTEKGREALNGAAH